MEIHLNREQVLAIAAWLIVALLGVISFFVVRMVGTVDESARGVVELKKEVVFVQGQVSGITDLRVSVETMKNGMNGLERRVSELEQTIRGK